MDPMNSGRARNRTEFDNHEEYMTQLNARYHQVTQDLRYLMRKDSPYAQEEEDLDRKIAALEKKREIVRGKRSEFTSELKYIKLELGSIYYYYNFSMCYEWCHAWHIRLPREIRDMIYQYLTPPYDDRAVKVDEEVRGPGIGFLFEKLFPRAHRYGVEVKKVGNLFVKEFLEVCYRESHFEILKPRYIGKLLSFDDYDVGFDASVVVQSIEITLDCSEKKEERGRLLRYLKPLNNVKCKTAVSIFLKFDKSYPRGVLEVLHDIAGWIFQMKEQGYELRVRTKTHRGRIEFMDHVGENLMEFEKWRLTWPVNESEFGGNKTYLNLLSANSRRKSPRDGAI